MYYMLQNPLSYLPISIACEDLLVFSKRQLNCSIECGFYNWKNVQAKLDEHEKSEMHREASQYIYMYDNMRT